MSLLSRILMAVSVALAVAMAGQRAWSADPKASWHRPCEQADLPGLWKVVHFTSHTDKKLLDSYADAFQWYLFGDDGTLRSLSSNQPGGELGEIRKTLESQPAVIRYSCSKDGELDTKRDDAFDADERWKAFYVTHDRADPNTNVELRAGDVVMALVDKDGRTLYARQMRKVHETAVQPPGKAGD
jgi:hypothetical protein